MIFCSFSTRTSLLIVSYSFRPFPTLQAQFQTSVVPNAWLSHGLSQQCELTVRLLGSPNSVGGAARDADFAEFNSNNLKAGTIVAGGTELTHKIYVP
jgi:hypothetical protein